MAVLRVLGVIAIAIALFLLVMSRVNTQRADYARIDLGAWGGRSAEAWAAEAEWQWTGSMIAFIFGVGSLLGAQYLKQTDKKDDSQRLAGNRR